ncbi:IS3 family transposase, partial [Pseudomonas syringae group sp. J309-1]
MRRPRAKRSIEPQLEKKIRLLHKEHRGALGSRGFVKALKAQGVQMGRHRMRSLMKSLG